MANKIPLGSWPRGRSAIGAPSVGLSLGGLRARRAHLRFTRQSQATNITAKVPRARGIGVKRDSQRGKLETLEVFDCVAKESAFLV
jgi:hypothetical protein